VDSNQLVHAVSAKAMHVSLCLRDEEANAAGENRSGGHPTELPRWWLAALFRGGQTAVRLI